MALCNKTNAPIFEYHVHPGKNRFWCRGLCMTGPTLLVAYLTWALLVTTGGLYFWTDAPYLWREVHPIIPIIAAILQFWAMVSLFRAGTVDPGIVPRGHTLESDARTTFTTHTMNGEIFETKWCSTCQMNRPPRVSHCRVCDNCVEAFDHHCPWIGNCVGELNYRYFLFFISILTIECAFIAITSTAHVALVAARDRKTFLGALKETPASVVVVVMCVGFGLVVGRLLVYHIYLISNNMTTNEDINYKYERNNRDKLLDSRGFFGNLFRMCYGPTRPSRLTNRRKLNTSGNQHNRPFGEIEDVLAMGQIPSDYKPKLLVPLDHVHAIETNATTVHVPFPFSSTDHSSTEEEPAETLELLHNQKSQQQTVDEQQFLEIHRVSEI